MTDEQKRQLAGDILRALGEAESQPDASRYRGPLTHVANPTPAQRESLAEAIMGRPCGSWSEQDRQFVAGECFRVLANL